MINVKIAGGVGHLHTFIKILNKLKKYQDKISFDVYDSTDLCKWNGGRINSDIKLSKSIINFYNKHNIGVFLTFTNDIIDTNDNVGNYLLNMINNKQNGVILVNENLRKYLRENYKDLKLIFSISGHKNNLIVNDNLLNFYKDLEQRYDVIIPRYEMWNDSNFNSKIDVSKYEIIVNGTCVLGCKIFEEHFDIIAKINREFDNPSVELPKDYINMNHSCWLKNENATLHPKNDITKYAKISDHHFTKDRYRQALNLGIKRFKIMGREFNDNDFEEEIFKHLDLLYDTIIEEKI